MRQTSNTGRLVPLLIVLSACATVRAAAAATKPATAPSTQPAFAKDIEAFEAADRKKPPAPGGVLFLGSSSIRMWKALAEDFPGVPVINRGFGGSTIPDSVRYAPRIVLPYRPKTIVFYAGDNDIAKGRTPEQVLADFKELVAVVHRDLPETRILFLAIKPSVARLKLMDKQKEANRLVREFTAADKRLGYIDVFTPMLGDDGQPRPELFVEDKLHMNRKGYELWTSVVAPYLKEGAESPGENKRDGSRP